MAAAIDRKLNVLIVASSLWIGGAESVIRHLALTIDRRRFNVSVCYLKERGQIGRELAAAGIDVIGISDSAKVDYFTFRKLLRIIRDRQIDIVHTHTTHGLVDAGLCKLLTPRLKLLHTFHFGNYPHIPPRNLWMERVFSRIADRLYAVGEGQRRQLRSALWFFDRSIRKIWNGVTPVSGGGEDSEFRTRVGADGRILIGTIATLIEQKGLDDLLKVARLVRDQTDQVRFVIVGEGVLRPQLEALRRELGLDDTVVLTGWITDAATKTLPTLDIFFQPSRWEAMSMVTLEAMAAAKPIVATRVGEAPYIIEDGTDGLLVDAGDVNGQAAAIMKLIVDPDYRRRLGISAKHKLERQLTVAHMTRAYEQAYLETA